MQCPRPHLLARVVVSLAALAVAACGSDSDGTERRAGPGDGYGGGGERGAPLKPVVVPPDSPKVIFLGDSISAGLHLESGAAFPAVLQRRLVDAGRPFVLVNAGVSGDTTAGGLARLDWLLAQEPDVVVVELGANDALRGVRASAIADNLRAILTKIDGAGARALLLGVRIPPSFGQEYSAEVADLYPVLATEFDVPLVPFFMEGVGGVPELNLGDGLHPTREGHERLADNVQDPLRALLDELAAQRAR